MQTQQGYSSLEILVTIIIMGILSSLGIPTLSRLLTQHQARGILAELHSDLNYARTTALQNGLAMTMCPYTPGGDACGQDWQKGWQVRQIGTTQIALKTYQI